MQKKTHVELLSAQNVEGKKKKLFLKKKQTKIQIDGN